MTPEVSRPMLIREQFSPSRIYPQIHQFPTDLADFLAAFRDGQTIDNNLNATSIQNTPQCMMLTTAINSGYLEKRGSPIHPHLLDIFLTDKGANMIREPQDRPFCEMAS